MTAKDAELVNRSEARRSAASVGAVAVLTIASLQATGTLLIAYQKTDERRFCEMQKVTKLVPMLFAFVLTLAVGVLLAAPAPGANNSTTKAKAVTKTKPAAGKSAETNLVLATAEDLSGTITLVDPTDKELTLVGSNGVPYDFELTRKTQVELANQKIGINQLATEGHKQATIHFLPTSDGNMAESIQISAS